MPLHKEPSEIIPDSEEERVREMEKEKEGKSREIREVIEISSDSESEDNEDFFNPPKWKTPSKPPNVAAKLLYRARRKIIESSDEDSGDDSGVEIIELPVAAYTSSATPNNKKRVEKAPALDELAASRTSPSTPIRTNSDEAIIVFDEPKSARTPLRVPRTDKVPTRPTMEVLIPSSISKKRTTTTTTTSPAITTTGTSRKPPPSTPAPAEKEKPATTPKKGTPRMTKKKLADLDSQRRHDYALTLFTELNQVVFKGGLPTTTKLNWNKRLLTTAGRAKWHKSRDGVQTTEIELADKILDCEERIRNTLSHEMCHLATWIIDEQVKEHHGPYFKRWAALVEKRRPDIEVSIKHNYEIAYPYQWKCAKCDKIYGRFSKSIKVNECVCGACREGRLVPQFTERKKAQKLSRMAAAKAQDSPHSTPVRSADKAETPAADVLYLSGGDDGSTDDEQDSDIEVLAIALGKSSIQDV